MGDWDLLYIQQLSSKGYVYNIFFSGMQEIVAYHWCSEEYCGLFELRGYQPSSISSNLVITIPIIHTCSVIIAPLVISKIHRVSLESVFLSNFQIFQYYIRIASHSPANRTSLSVINLKLFVESKNVLDKIYLVLNMELCQERNICVF